MIQRLLDRILTIKDLQFLPGHYYSPVTTPQEQASLENTKFANDEPDTLDGIDINEGYQFQLLKEIGKYYKDAPFPENKSPEFRYYYDNEFFSYNSSIELFCIIRHFKPTNIIEVGSGFSSALMLDTNERFFSNSIGMTFIEPNPQDRLTNLLRKEDLNNVKVFPKKVQEVDISIFDILKKDDILFVDSSHVSKPGSDLNYIIFNILPRLNPGVIIHFHDIFYPFEYPKNWVMGKGGFGWNEVYLIRSFLMYNRLFNIIFFNSLLEYKYKEWFQENMPLCLKKQGGSLFIVKN